MAGAGDVAARPSHEELEALVASQSALIAGMRAELSELRARLAANSRNYNLRGTQPDSEPAQNLSVSRRSDDEPCAAASHVVLPGGRP